MCFQSLHSLQDFLKACYKEDDFPLRSPPQDFANSVATMSKQVKVRQSAKDLKPLLQSGASSAGGDPMVNMNNQMMSLLLEMNFTRPWPWTRPRKPLSLQSFAPHKLYLETQRLCAAPKLCLCHLKMVKQWKNLLLSWLQQMTRAWRSKRMMHFQQNTKAWRSMKRKQCKCFAKERHKRWIKWSRASA